MKLLDWMHRKLRNNNGEEHKELSFRHACKSVDDLQYIPKTSYCRGSQTKWQRESQLRRSFAGLETAIAEDKHLEQELADQNSELFHGFLAIGTFGIEPMSNDPSTPTFSISAKTIAVNKTEATENELNLINDELEKALGAQSDDNGWNFSSRRNSHVSTGRSSHGSITTLSDKSRESADSNTSGTFLPLQEYLLGSAIDFPETTVAKKDHRVSLGELLQKTEENSAVNSDRRQKRVDKSPVKLMKKMLKVKLPHSSQRSTSGNAVGTADATSSDKKMQKILRMFQKKVHPESSTTCHASYKTTSKTKHSKQASNKGGPPSNGDIIKFPESASSGENWHFQSQLSPPQCSLPSGDLSGCKKEYWINTDSEYLVLEL